MGEVGQHNEDELHLRRYDPPPRLPAPDHKPVYWLTVQSRLPLVIGIAFCFQCCSFEDFPLAFFEL